MIKLYYKLTKPGIIYGNSLAAIAGFFLGQKNNFNILLFLAMLVGLGCIIASACVFNNIHDAEMDSKMERTKNRAMAAGLISKQHAALFGTVLLFLGIILLTLFTNLTTLAVALIGFIFYVFLYTPLKSKVQEATLIGSVAGAVPPVVGYTAVTNNIDVAAVILFFAMVCWQMPHFYAIGIHRIKDYASAKVPILPILRGIEKTKRQIVGYVVAYSLVSLLLVYYKYTGFLYLVAMILVNAYWLKISLSGFNLGTENTIWAKQVFKFSLVVLLTFCVIICVEAILKIFIKI